MAAFARLSEAERERLEMLVEEAGEIVQIGCKILRHGYDSCHPDDLTQTNRALLVGELADLFAVAASMMVAGEIQDPTALFPYEDVLRRKLRYTHHQERAKWELHMKDLRDRLGPAPVG